MARNEAKIKFSADTAEYDKALKELNASNKELVAELKNAEAEYKNTGDKAEYVHKKTEAYEKQLELNKQKQEAFNGKIQVATTIYGENSVEVTRLKTQLVNAQTEEEKLKTAIDGVNTELEDNGQSVNTAGSGWTTFKGIAANVATEIVEKLVGALKQAAQYVLSVGSTFESSMSNVEALSGATGSALSSLESKAKELGASTKFSASEVADAFGYMALAGWDTNQMLDGISGVLDLAAASGMELANASDMVTDYLSAFGLEAKDATKMSNMLAYAQANSNTTAAQLGEAYGNCAANLNASGQSIETVTALLEAMANQGTKGSEAGTMLKSVMSQITQKMSDGKIQIGQYNIAVQDQAGNFRSLIDIISDVSEATSSMGEAERAAALAGTFSETALSGLNLVLNEGVDNIRDYYTELGNCDYAASSMAATMQDNLKGSMTELESATEGLGIAVYDLFADDLKSVVDVATDAISGITAAISPAKSDLELFIDEIKEGIENVQTLHEEAQSTIEAATSDNSTYQAYIDIVDELYEKYGDLTDATKLDEYEQYELKKAIETLQTICPELTDAYDEQTNTLTLTAAAFNKVTASAQKQAIMTAYLKSVEEETEALAEAQIEHAKATAAQKAALETLQPYLDSMGMSLEELQGKMSTNQQYGFTAEIRSAYNDYASATKAVNETAAAIDTASASMTDQQAVLSELQNELGFTDSQMESFKNSTDEAATATDSLSESTATVTTEVSADMQAIIEKADEMSESISTDMTSAVDALNVFDGGTQVTADDVLANLQSQIDGITTWKDHMITLGEQAGSGMSQEFYDYLVEMGPQGANLVQTLVDTLNNDTSKFSEISNSYATALSLSDSSSIISSYTAAGKASATAFAGSSASTSEFTTAGNSAVSNTADAINGKSGDVVNATSEMSDEAGEAMTKSFQSSTDEAKQIVDYGTLAMAESIKNNTSNGMNNAYNACVSSLNNLKSQFANTTLKFNVLTPSFSMSGSFNAKTKSVPTVNTYWSEHAKGGVFAQPTLFSNGTNYHLVGEAGPEAIAPIDVLQGYVRDAVAQASLIDYNELGKSVARAMSSQSMTMQIDKRTLGRVVREVM